MPAEPPGARLREASGAACSCPRTPRSCSGTAASTRGSTARPPCAASRARSSACPNAWFVIVGGRHPRAHAPDARLLEALAAAHELGVADRVLEAPWGPYDQRIAWYAEADCAICLHHPRARDRALAPHAPRRPALGPRAGRLVCRRRRRRARRGGRRRHQRADRRCRRRGRRARRAALGDRGGATRAASPPAGLAAELAWPRVLAPLVALARQPARRGRSRLDRVVERRLAQPDRRRARGEERLSRLSAGRGRRRPSSPSSARRSRPASSRARARLARIADQQVDLGGPQEALVEHDVLLPVEARRGRTRPRRRRGPCA